MKLATVRAEKPGSLSERRDGRLAVVSPNLRRAVLVPADRYPNLLSAVEDWDAAEPMLREIDAELRAGGRPDAVELSKRILMAPLPRTYAWLDGSAFVYNVLRIYKASGMVPPEEITTIPLMFQGASDGLLGPRDPIPLYNEAHCMDFEAELAVVLGDVPAGTRSSHAAGHIRLLTLMNDVSLRRLLPRELRTGFGFVQSKPASSFAPFAVTPDELGADWSNGRARVQVLVQHNDNLIGRLDAGEMLFSFCDLIEHAARTRPLCAGTLLGSGTVSNKREGAGAGCLVELRMREKAERGEARTPFLKAGDTVEIEAVHKGRSVFGKISQKVRSVPIGA